VRRRRHGSGWPDRGILKHHDIVIREATDDDYLDLVEVIMSCFAEYPNCVMDIDGEIPELRRIATHFRENDGKFWVGERDGRVVACVGASPSGESEESGNAGVGVELKKLYVHRSARRIGLASVLAELVFEEAARRNATFVDLWSDTRFDTAHAFYTRLGFEGGTRSRDLNDLSDTVEFHFRKQL
jgi:putative acetyltransferase